MPQPLAIRVWGPPPPPGFDASPTRVSFLSRWAVEREARGQRTGSVSVFDSLLLELLNILKSLNVSSLSQALGPSVPLARGCTNPFRVLTCDIEGLSFSMVSLEALSRPAGNTCECRRALESNLLHSIYKGSQGHPLEVMAASVFQNLLGDLSIWTYIRNTLTWVYIGYLNQWIHSSITPSRICQVDFATTTLALFDLVSSEKYMKQRCLRVLWC